MKLKICIISLCIFFYGCAHKYDIPNDSNRIFINDRQMKINPIKGKKVFLQVQNSTKDGFYVEKFWHNPYLKFVLPLASPPKLEKHNYQGVFAEDLKKKISDHMKQNGLQVVESEAEAEVYVLLDVLRACTYVANAEIKYNLMSQNMHYNNNAVVHIMTYVNNEKFEFFDKITQKNIFIPKVILVPFPFGNYSKQQYVFRTELIHENDIVGKSEWVLSFKSGVLLAIPIVFSTLKVHCELNFMKNCVIDLDKQDYDVRIRYDCEVTCHKDKISNDLLCVTETAGPLNLLYEEYADLLLSYITNKN